MTSWILPAIYTCSVGVQLAPAVRCCALATQLVEFYVFLRYEVSYHIIFVSLAFAQRAVLNTKADTILRILPLTLAQSIIHYPYPSPHLPP